MWLRFEHAVVVKPKEVARVLEQLEVSGVASGGSAAATLEVAGRDLVTGLPRTLVLTVAELRAGAATEVLPW